MLLRLPSFKRLILFSFLFLALLASALFFSGYEFGIPPELDGALSIVREDPDSSISVIGPSVSSLASPIVEFDSSVSPSMFRTWGNLTLEDGSALPYLILNATLWDGDLLIESTRHMMIDMGPGDRRSFDIRESCRLSPERGYSSLLEVEEPEDFFVSERHDCQVVEDDSRVVVWEEMSSPRGVEAGSEKASYSSLSPPGSAKVASISSYYKSTERYRDSSGAQMEAELEVETDYEDDEMVGSFYVGSTTSNKYHRPDCRYAEKIKDENRIFFSNVAEAEEAGYSPCKVCNPE
ncbi:MAG: Uncharacterized protein XD72_1468 [Methanothrix harundinacea]|uniref:Ada DNA repair metal-binding domain-containing protein n=1 Tax=Methanothrix harundinacea TaxID=301375 RepID=A0A101FTP7_9EURY|nr:MAG: Uncharacterized protein XD72_1468 [Methanothrix harundinacea]KUK97296.1 MAG: Uncharacterized protein XE07_0451 [Methanothrix harundinacea]